MAYDHTTSTDDVIQGVNLEGKTAVVTGASAGLGIETVKTLAGAGARVVMVARDQNKLDAAAEGIHESVPEAQLETVVMDLADLASVKSAAAELLELAPRIELLINNAGVMACPLERTADGFELQFGTNHLGHFLFTCSIMPGLLAGAPGRIVNLSSAGHRLGDVNFDDPNYQEREYDKWEAYGQSKTANVLFTLGLEARLASRGVHSFAVHPGMIVTELGRHLVPEDIEMLQSRASDSAQSEGFKTIPQGAATSVWAATTSELDGRGGLYLENCGIGVPEQEGVPGGYYAYVMNTDNAERLWTLSEELVGQNFELAN